MVRPVNDWSQIAQFVDRGPGLKSRFLLSLFSHVTSPKHFDLMHGLFIMYNVLLFSNNTTVYSCFQNLYIIQIFGILVDLVDYVHNKT